MHPQPQKLVCRTRTLDLSAPVVMGVLNVTPDSFSDGGRHADVDSAVAHGLQMVEQGAAIIDVGGESTRPRALPVARDEELRRVIPVIQRLVTRTSVLISIDTSDPEVMTAATQAGAEIVNDVRGLRRAGAIAAAAASRAGICLMHMRGEPQTMQEHPVYDDVVREVADYLSQRVAECEAAGISRERICVDPGIGFGKTAAQNLRLLANLHIMSREGRPILVGVSRKSLIGIITGRPAGERDAGSNVLAALCVALGARIIRAHDVAGAIDALRIATALELAAAGEG